MGLKKILYPLANSWPFNTNFDLGRVPDQTREINQDSGGGAGNFLGEVQIWFLSGGFYFEADLRGGEGGTVTNFSVNTNVGATIAQSQVFLGYKKDDLPAETISVFWSSFTASMVMRVTPSYDGSGSIASGFVRTE